MKKLAYLFLSFSSLFAQVDEPQQKVSLFVQADEAQSQKPKSQLQKNSRVYIGAQVYHLNLKVKDFTTYTGVLGGVIVGYEYRKKRGLYVGVNGTWALGDVDDNHSRRRFLHNGEIEATFGYNFVISKLTITPFAGYGFDYSQQRLTAVGFTPIELKYLKYYVPIGIIFNYRFNRNFDLGCKFKWMPYIDRSLDIDVTKGAHWKTKYTNGYYVDLPFTWTFAHGSRINWGISFIPFFKYSEDGKAFAKTTSGMEFNLPEQRNLIWGGKLALNIDF